MAAKPVLRSPTLEDAFQQAAKIPGAKILAVMRPLVHKGLSFDIVAPEITGNANNYFSPGDFTLGSLSKANVDSSEDVTRKFDFAFLSIIS